MHHSHAYSTYTHHSHMPHIHTHKGQEVIVKYNDLSVGQKSKGNAQESVMVQKAFY